MYVEIQDVKNAKRYAVEVSRGVKGIVLETRVKYQDEDDSLGTILFQVEAGKPVLYCWNDDIPIKIDLYDLIRQQDEQKRAETHL